MLALRGGGVATSGRDRRRFGPDAALHHLIDPATGAPAEPGPLTVTVVAASATVAETHATALAILPVERAVDYVARAPLAVGTARAATTGRSCHSAICRSSGAARVRFEVLA